MTDYGSDWRQAQRDPTSTLYQFAGVNVNSMESVVKAFQSVRACLETASENGMLKYPLLLIDCVVFYDDALPRVMFWRFVLPQTKPPWSRTLPTCVRPLRI
jgi:hypothetical protein